MSRQILRWAHEFNARLEVFGGLCPAFEVRAPMYHFKRKSEVIILSCEYDKDQKEFIIKGTYTDPGEKGRELS